ncbi:MAG: hypothetical protein NVS3B18_13680 [Candidatus Dormibacteria bacterium]
MARPLVTIIMAGGAGVAARALYRALRVAHERGELDAATALVAGMGLLISLPIAATAFSGGLTYQLDTRGDLVALFPSWYVRVNELAKGVVVLSALGLMLRQLFWARARFNPAALLGIAVWGVAAFASGLHGETLISLSSGTLLACLLAASLMPRGPGACAGAGLAGVSIAVASGLLAALRPGVALLPCARKCSFVGSLLTGVVPNANLLGITLAASIPFVYLGFRGRPRNWLIGYLLVMTFATGARTAMAAAAITVAVLVLLRPTLDGPRPRWPLGLVPGLVVTATLGVWIYLVDHRWSATALTDRGVLWNLARHAIGQSPLIGYGPANWADLYKVSQIPATAQRSAHNQLLDLLFASGYLGAGLLAAMVAVTIATASRARPGILIILGSIMIIGATEGTWQVGSFDFLSFTMIALILTGDIETPLRRVRPSGPSASIGAGPRQLDAGEHSLSALAPGPSGQPVLPP